ncbi:hypothetical protein DPMN_074686 [Dreissena polymorpha]|uniref:Uncharacterized protein n=1 Tax=Dreissena polymorpha TaxID=45954 RepID=A0A9D3YIZ2_DREPO|nr:hypothetical protein DPMN_074686 [Dreissena polymorpha]
MGSCDPLFGPTGTEYECKKFDQYSGYQRAICYRNAYIKSITGNKHACSQSNANYCYFQCMLEKYDRASGNT